MLLAPAVAGGPALRGIVVVTPVGKFCRECAFTTTKTGTLRDVT